MSIVPSFAFVLFLLIYAHPSLSASDYEYRATFALSHSGGSPLADAEVLLIMDTLSPFSTGHIFANCSDLDFTFDLYGETGLRSVDFWIESSCPSPATRIWVKIPSLPAGNSTLYAFSGSVSGKGGKMLNWTNDDDGFIMLKDSPGGCWNGWSEVSSFNDGRLLRTSDAWAANGTEQLTHDHSVEFFVPAGIGETIKGSVSVTPLKTAEDWHEHYVVGHSTEATTMPYPPSENFLLCSKKTLDLEDHNKTYDMVGIFEGLPLWASERSLSKSRFLRGASSAVAGDRFGSEYHTHEITSFAGMQGGSGTVHGANPGPPEDVFFVYDGMTGGHNHSITMSIPTPTPSLPPFVDVDIGTILFDDVRNGSLIDGGGGGGGIMLVLAQTAPPIGWEIDARFTTGIYKDRYLRARPDNRVFGNLEGGPHGHAILASAEPPVDGAISIEEGFPCSPCYVASDWDHFHSIPWPIWSGLNNVSIEYPHHYVRLIKRKISAATVVVPTEDSTVLMSELSCFGYHYLHTDVCSRRGNCTNPEQCECEKGYGGANCSLHTCNNVVWTSMSVCGGEGFCFDVDRCDCTRDPVDGTNSSDPSAFVGQFCEYPVCYSVPANDSQSCGLSGTCDSPDKCSCPFGYNPTRACSIHMCWDIDADKTTGLPPLVCHGHGSCSSVNNCTCQPGYSTNRNCSIHTCWNIDADQTTGSVRVCHGHGSCSSVDNCTCQTGYNPERNCSIHTCWGIDADQTTGPVPVCSGHGPCVGVDRCNCDSDWNVTANCSIFDDGSRAKDPMPYWWVAFPIVALFVAAVVLVVVAIIAVACCRARMSGARNNGDEKSLPIQLQELEGKEKGEEKSDEKEGGGGSEKSSSNSASEDEKEEEGADDSSSESD